ncbi:MAG TPA: hypothetical protein VLG67_03910 [Candidatus Saccharimonadales bacterium]|nr:hypothetical protein [Candidatus Saccharimonadales bacterium]
MKLFYLDWLVELKYGNTQPKVLYCKTTMLTDLIFVLRHIKAIIDEYGLPTLYAQFVSTLQQIASTSTPELQEALKDSKEKIKKAHEKLEPIGWTDTQVKYFMQFGASNVLGKEGWNKFQLALTDNSANTPGAVEQINLLTTEITQLHTNANNILTSLGTIANELEIEEGKSVVQIVFDEEVSIDTFIDMAKQSDEWTDIIRAFSMFAKEAPENTKIIASSKGSPYMVWLLTARVVGETICATIKPFIELYKEVLTAKEKALTLEDMKIGIDGKKFELFKMIEEHERKRIMEVLESVGEIKANDHLSEVDKNDALAALRNAGPKLYDFITKGGKVDVSKKDGDHKAFSNFQLETSYQEADKLKARVQKLLTARKDTKKAEEEKENQASKRRDKIEKEGKKTEENTKSTKKD